VCSAGRHCQTSFGWLEWYPDLGQNFVCSRGFGQISGTVVKYYCTCYVQWGSCSDYIYYEFKIRDKRLGEADTRARSKL
jgi:hypothetical protein